jgi:serine-type D-Ala-D-Ala carboxypeptidase/endopeptidase (penicillin-binding protein 4)
MKTTFFLIVTFLFLSCNLFAQLLENNKDLSNAAVSYIVLDADSGEEIIAFQQHKSMTPASILKLLSTASSLEKFGKDDVFKTIIAYSGEISAGVLNGNIYIIGTGDPALGSVNFHEHYYSPVSFLTQWVSEIKQAGIQEINGEIFAVTDQHPMEKIPRTWIWEDISNYYGSAGGILNVFDNTYQLHFNTQGQVGDNAVLTKTYPVNLGLSFDNQVVIANGGGDQAYIFGAPESPTRFITGSLPQGHQQFIVKGAVPNPEFLLARHFFDEIKQAGIGIMGKYGTAILPEKYTILFIQESPSLKELIKVTNHQSINLYSNQIGAKFDTQLDIHLAAKQIIRYWETKGLDTDGLYLEDLCGLSPFNQISANQFAFILKYMYNSQNKDVFLKSLPVSGESGTLKYFGQNASFKGKFSGKSGSIKRVYSYAGYLNSKSGKTLIVVSMVNHYSCTPTDTKKALVAFYDYLYLNY